MRRGQAFVKAGGQLWPVEQYPQNHCLNSATCVLDSLNMGLVPHFLEFEHRRAPASIVAEWPGVGRMKRTSLRDALSQENQENRAPTIMACTGLMFSEPHHVAQYPLLSLSVR